jgi:hypothetical protein
VCTHIHFTERSLDEVKRPSPEIEPRHNHYLWSPLAVLVLALATWMALNWVDNSARSHLQNGITTVLRTTQQALRSWSRQELNAANTWAANHLVVDLTEALCDTPPNREALLTTPAQQRLRDLLSGVLGARGYEGSLSSGRGISISPLPEIAMSASKTCFLEALIS